MILWHNPRCSKSRQTLALLQEKGIDPEVRLYLNDPPNQQELREVLARLGIAAINLMRVKEPEFKEIGLTKTDAEDQLIAAMAQTPKLIERPVLINGDRAALGRPPENVLTIL